MNEHEMCCGTVADKVKLCAEIEQRDSVIAAQQRRIEELVQARDAAEANAADFEAALDAVYAAMEALKAQWQADAIEKCVRMYKRKVFDGPDLYSDGVLDFARDLRQRAQEAANAPNP